MAESAKVTSLDALARFKTALAEFGERAGLAISNAENDVQRTIWWLQNEQTQHWQRQIKRREKMLSEAKMELSSAQLQSPDLRPSLVIERKRVQACERALEEARMKLQRTRHWARTLEREYMLFKGALTGLSGRLDRDIPMAMIRLGKLQGHLEKYVRLSSGTSSSSGRTKPATEDETEEAKP